VNSALTTSDLINSGLMKSDLMTSDLMTSDLMNSDLIKSDTMKAAQHVRVAMNFSELDNWGADYEKFLAAIGDYGLFYQKGWLRAIWPVYSSQSSQPFFIGIWRQQELIALAPLQLLEKGAVQGWRRVLTFFGTNHPTLGNPWPDILVLKEELRPWCINQILATLALCHRDWDQIEFNHWPDSPNVTLLKHEWSQTEFLLENNRSAQIDLRQGFDTYLASRSSKLRYQMRKHRRNLEAVASVKFLTTDSLCASRWSAVRDMHFKRQQRLKTEGHDRYSVFENPEEAEALRLAMEWAAQQGCARHYWLDIDNQTAAFSLGLRIGHTHIYYFIGMDERAEPYSGGMLLLMHLLQEEASQGIQTVDMMFGMNENKERFSNQQCDLLHCVHENPRLISAMRNGWVRLAKRIMTNQPSSPTASPQSQVLDSPR